MSKRLTGLLLVVLAWSVFSCAPLPNRNNAPNGSPAGSATTLPIPVRTSGPLTPTQTKTPKPFPTDTPTIAPSPVPPTETQTQVPQDPFENHEYIEACPTIKEIDLEYPGLTGQLLANNNVEQLYVKINLENGKTTPIESIYTIVSPNGDYRIDIKELIDHPDAYIINSEEEVVLSINNDGSWFIPIGWLNQTQILMDVVDSPLHAFLAINPFTGEEVMLRSEYPDIITINYPISGWEESAFALAVYDPTLTYVIYPKDDWVTYVIWNLGSNSIEAEIKFVNNFSYPPRWLPGSQEFIVANVRRDRWQERVTTWPNNELYRVSLDGRVTRLTDFDDLLEPDTIIKHYYLSPDGLKVAFWSVEDWFSSPRHGYPAVLDMQKRTITRYCYEGNFKDYSGGNPVWSPDSQYVSFHAIVDDEEWLLIIDTATNKIFGLKGYFPWGWMASGD